MSDWAVNEKRLGLLESKTDKLESVVLGIQMELRGLQSGLQSTASAHVEDISRIQGSVAEALALLRLIRGGRHGG